MEEHVSMQKITQKSNTLSLFNGTVPHDMATSKIQFMSCSTTCAIFLSLPKPYYAGGTK